MTKYDLAKHFYKENVTKKEFKPGLDCFSSSFVFIKQFLPYIIIGISLGVITFLLHK